MAAIAVIGFASMPAPAKTVPVKRGAILFDTELAAAALAPDSGKPAADGGICLPSPRTMGASGGKMTQGRQERLSRTSTRRFPSA
ncbi:MAG: hypothetical protein ISN28_04570 [Ectothiorhodospiraceae bacterium AqS1]|nr:hypothetical protein [Ectothiorhodospiraceae bacterium AqS1]